MSSKNSSASSNFIKLLLTATAAGAVGLSYWAHRNNFQSPLFLLKYLAKPHSKVGPLFATRQIRYAENPRELAEDLEPLEQIVEWKGSHAGLNSVLRETETNTFLVAKNGVLKHRWLRNGYSEATPQSSWSVAKSVVGLVTGQLLAEKVLTEDTRLVEILPEYATGGPFDQITVAHLLDMKSGIDLAEEYNEWQAYTGVGGMMTTKDLPGYLMHNRNTFAAPGSVSDYRSIDTQFLSMILTRVTGQNIAALVKERIWNKIGAVDTASWTLDDENGIEKGFMGLNASARDFLKLGLLIADRGKVADEQVVPADFIDRILKPQGTIFNKARSAWGYSSKWWHPEGSEEHQDLTALGVYGQFVYVNLKHNVVIAKNSDYKAEKDEDELISVFRQIAEKL